MALELRQQLKLSQQLVMTPQLQQAIKLLQLSRLELMETVQQELLENPFLEEGPAEASGDMDREADVDVSEVKAEEFTLEDNTGVTTDAGELNRDADWENYLGEFSTSARQVQMRESEAPEEGMSFEARLSNKPSLEGHLMWQLRLGGFSEDAMALGEVIIGNLGSTGYLQITLEEALTELEASSGLRLTPEAAEDILHAIQRFDPVGVAARSPQECLLTQLDVLNDHDPILIELVREHLEDLEKRRYKPLARKFKISMDELKEYLEALGRLDPVPGASYGSGEPFYVSPDVNVYKYDGEFVIVLNDDGLPALHLNDIYMAFEGKKTGSSEAKEYMQDKMRSAVWLIKSLHQRQRTLYKVMESIVRHQREFFEVGVTKLKPLILKDIAEDISMHESTVSRITTNKYVSTAHGIFELKFFFNSALELDDGSQVGSESVKALIKKLIGEEDPKKPLSDERIAEILKDKLQVNIARRTVAKYRTVMGIPSSSKRREVF